MTIIVCIIGIVLALIHRERSPKALTALAASLALLLLVSVVGLVIEFVVYRLLFGSVQSGGWYVSQALRLWSWFSALCQALSIAGLIYAVLCDRGFDILNFSRK